MAEEKPIGSVVHGPTLFSGADIFLFKEGNHFQLYDKLGSRLMTVDGRAGVYFAVWAPNAERVAVIGDFNGWSADAHPLAPRWDGERSGHRRLGQGGGVGARGLRTRRRY